MNDVKTTESDLAPMQPAVKMELSRNLSVDLLNDFLTGNNQKGNVAVQK